MQTHPSLSLSIAAPKPGAFAPRRIEVADQRADDHRRIVVLGRNSVEIARCVGGVFMHITLMPSAYRGVVLRLTEARGNGFAYEVRLAHRDPDLSVILLEADDDSEVQAEWRLWARFLRLPTLVERIAGQPELELPTLGGVTIAAPSPRRRGKTLTSRRPRFLVRRKVGRWGLTTAPVQAAREIFSGPPRDR